MDNWNKNYLRECDKIHKVVYSSSVCGLYWIPWSKPVLKTRLNESDAGTLYIGSYIRSLFHILVLFLQLFFARTTYNFISFCFLKSIPFTVIVAFNFYLKHTAEQFFFVFLVGSLNRFRYMVNMVVKRIICRIILRLATIEPIEKIQRTPIEVIVHRRSFARKTHPIIPGDQNRAAASHFIQYQCQCMRVKESVQNDSRLRFVRSNTGTEHSSTPVTCVCFAFVVFMRTYWMYGYNIRSASVRTVFLSSCSVFKKSISYWNIIATTIVKHA